MRYQAAAEPPRGGFGPPGWMRMWHGAGRGGDRELAGREGPEWQRTAHARGARAGPGTLCLRGLGPGPPAGTRRLPSRRCPQTPPSPRRLPPAGLAAGCCPGRRAGVLPGGGRPAPPGGRLGGSERRWELAASSTRPTPSPVSRVGRREEGLASGPGAEARRAASSARRSPTPRAPGDGSRFKGGKKGHVFCRYFSWIHE